MKIKVKAQLTYGDKRIVADGYRNFVWTGPSFEALVPITIIDRKPAFVIKSGFHALTVFRDDDGNLLVRIFTVRNFKKNTFELHLEEEIENPEQIEDQQKREAVQVALQPLEPYYFPIELHKQVKRMKQGELKGGPLFTLIKAHVDGKITRYGLKKVSECQV